MTFLKHLMLEYKPFGAVAFDFLKIVIVQRSYIALQLTTFKLLCQDLRAEACLVFYDERAAVFTPGNNIISFWVLDDVECFGEEHRHILWMVKVHLNFKIYCNF